MRAIKVHLEMDRFVKLGLPVLVQKLWKPLMIQPLIVWGRITTLHLVTVLPACRQKQAPMQLEKNGAVVVMNRRQQQRQRDFLLPV